MNAITKTDRTSLIVKMASNYGMEPAAFTATIKNTVMPGNATNEQFAAFLLVAHQYDLNPFTKELHAFAGRGGAITPVVSIDGWIKLANNHPQMDGMDFDYQRDEQGNLIACVCKIWRKDRTRPAVAIEFLSDCRRNTDPWKSHPSRMLKHKAFKEAARYAFGFSGLVDEDDARDIERSQSQAPKVSDLNTRLANPEPPPFVLEPETDDAEAQAEADEERAAIMAEGES